MVKYRSKTMEDTFGYGTSLTVSYTYMDDDGEHGVVSTYETNEKLLEEWEPVLEEPVSE